MQTLMEKGCQAKGYQPTPSFLNVAMQLRDTLEFRHGIMMLGPAGSGKSVCREVLKWAMEHMELPAQQSGQKPALTVKGVKKVNRKLLRLVRQKKETDEEAYLRKYRGEKVVSAATPSPEESRRSSNRTPTPDNAAGDGGGSAQGSRNPSPGASLRAMLGSSGAAQMSHDDEGPPQHDMTPEVCARAFMCLC